MQSLILRPKLQIYIYIQKYLLQTIIGYTSHNDAGISLSLRRRTVLCRSACKKNKTGQCKQDGSSAILGPLAFSHSLELFALGSLASVDKIGNWPGGFTSGCRFLPVCLILVFPGCFSRGLEGLLVVFVFVLLSS